MYTANATILLSLVLTLLSAAVSEAELLVCSQPDGSELYTDQPQGEDYCKKYEPVSQLVYLSPRIGPNVPSHDATYEEQAAVEPEGEEQLVPSDAGGEYNSAQNNLADYDADFVQQFLPAGGYIYVQRFYGVHHSRHRDGKDFRNEPPPHHNGAYEGKQEAKHDAKHTDPAAPHSPPRNSPVNHREDSGAPLTRFYAGSPQSVPAAASPQSAAATTSAHGHGTSGGAGYAAPGQSSATTSSGHFPGIAAGSGNAGETPQPGGSNRK